MTTKVMIKILRYKADNIKTKLEPSFFIRVADRLRKYETVREHKNYRCPNCGTWNKTWILREQTILKINIEKQDEVVHCWHCGQKVRIGEK